jgi:hypothetical protein
LQRDLNTSPFSDRNTCFFAALLLMSSAFNLLTSFLLFLCICRLLRDGPIYGSVAQEASEGDKESPAVAKTAAAVQQQQQQRQLLQQLQQEVKNCLTDHNPGPNE